MKNVEMKTTGQELTIKINLSKDFGPSRTGKTIIIASTEGNISVNGDDKIKIGINCYKTR